jgi:hypothetical protein
MHRAKPDIVHRLRQRGIGSFIVDLMCKDRTLQKNRRYAYGFRLRPYHAQDGLPERCVAWSKPVTLTGSVPTSELVKRTLGRIAILALGAAANAGTIGAWLFRRRQRNRREGGE